MKKIFSYIAISGLFLLNGCTKFVELQPTSSITSTSFWKTQADAQAGIIGAYDGLQAIYRREFGEFIHWTDGRSDVVAPGQNQEIITQITQNNITPTTVGADWTALYRAINLANLALANIPNINMGSDARNSLMGEAYFIRAYCYFMGARVWGDMPLVTTPTTDASNDLKPRRSARAEVLKQVRADIESALAKVPQNFGGAAASDRGRATKGAVNALKLDFLLWMARVEKTGEDDLNAATKTAEAILANPMYSMVTNFQDLFTVRNNSETIFAIQYNVNNQETGNLGADLTPLAEGPYTGGKQYYQPSEKLKNAYKANPKDKRAASTYQAFTSLNASSMCIKYIGSAAGVTLRNFDSNIMVYRLGGIKLMYAEALNELGRTGEAITQLNDVRLRAGVGETAFTGQADIRQAILDENLVELPFEGSRWFTLIRSGRISQEVTAIKTNVFDQHSKLLWPISAISLRQNPNLSQNTAYK